MKRKDTKPLKTEGNDLCCRTDMLELLTSYSDGRLNKLSSRRFERHIKKCSKCAYALKLTQIAIKASSGLREEYIERSGEMTAESTMEARSKLLRAIRTEPLYAKQNVSPKTEIRNKAGFRRLMLSFSAAAAGFIVIAGVVVALSQGGGVFLDKNEFANDFRPSVSSEMTAGNDSTNEKKATDSVDGTDAPKDTSIITSREDNAQGSDQEYIYDYDAAIAEALYVAEIDDSENHDAIILMYRKDSIEKYKVIFTDIFNRSGDEAVIEIIGGDNPQKLIEYIGTQMAEDLSAKAVEEGADFLIVSTGG